jgi:uncharacterized protein (DUF2235 family)
MSDTPSPPATTPTVRLVLFFDGTDNTPKDRTNVWRAHQMLAAADAAGVPQLGQYFTGVGTEAGSLLTGSIFGVGVARKIREGYAWLVENYRDGAEIFVFGFSRGAFTARSLVQMIATCGLTRKETLEEWSVDRAFDRYEAISRQEAEEVRPLWRLRYWKDNLAARPPGWNPDETESRLMDDTRVREVKVRMAGLWDTVGSLGTDGLTNRDAARQKAAAHNVRPTKYQEHGYHALAIDEHRPLFEVTLWRTFLEADDSAKAMEDYARRYEQRWFIGAHSDVGGGYNEDDDRLPDLALSWMLGKATALGLAFTHQLGAQAGAWHGQIHDSFKGFAGGVLSIWDKVMPGNQRNYREIGRRPKDVVTAAGKRGVLWSIHETLDDSVVRRWCEDPTYRPPNLVDYFRRHPDRLPPGTSLAQHTRRIHAARYWNETGVYLTKDTPYRLRLVPGVGEPLRDADSVARGIEGEDWNTFAHRSAALLHGKRKDDAKWFALIGTVDRDHAWAIRDGAVFTVPVSGQLVCYFNDVQLEWFYGNNAGWVVLELDRA